MTTERTMSFIFCAALLVAFQAAFVVADLPVHCLKREIIGEWEFNLDSPIDSITGVDDARALCGHHQPDKSRFNMMSALQLEVAETTKITLEAPNVAFDSHGSRGTWTMVYDEGFNVEVGGRTYFAFSSYRPKKFMEDLDSLDYNDYESICGETLIGWYHDTSSPLRNWGCYRATKAGAVQGQASEQPTLQTLRVVEPGHSDSGAAGAGAAPSLSQTASREFSAESVPTVNYVSASPSSASLPSSSFEAEEVSSSPTPTLADRNAYYKYNRNEDNYVFMQTSMTAQAHTRKKLSAGSSRRYEDNQELVQSINSQNLGWEAGMHHEFMGLSLAEVQSKFFGNKRAHSLVRGNDNPAALQKDDKPRKSSQLRGGVLSPSFIQVDDLPKSWDWRNVDGENYLPEIRHQGDCGSCYTMGTLAMLESRIRIQTRNKNKVSLSPQFVVSCNMYTQGCDGGYPFLVNKFASEFPLVPESCMPYQGRDVDCSTKCDLSSLSETYAAKDFGYIGGYYGGCSYDAMMLELYHNGPIVASFEPAMDFSYYQRGVYRSSNTHMTRQEDWTKVDHTILLVGWGEENGVKYWIARNTWGKNWGENGYFRMLRGADESGIESIAVKGTPVIRSRA